MSLRKTIRGIDLGAHTGAVTAPRTCVSDTLKQNSPMAECRTPERRDPV